MDFGKARLDFAEDVEKFMASGKGNTRTLSDPEITQKRRIRFKRKRKKKKPKVTAFMQAHITAQLAAAVTVPDIDPNRTDKMRFWSNTTAKVEVPATSQGG